MWRAHCVMEYEFEEGVPCHNVFQKSLEELDSLSPDLGGGIYEFDSCSLGENEETHQGGYIQSHRMTGDKQYTDDLLLRFGKERDLRSLYRLRLVQGQSQVLV